MRDVLVMPRGDRPVRVGVVMGRGTAACSLCEWDRPVPWDGSEQGLLTLHWASDHPEEYARLHPESAAILYGPET